MAQIVIIIPPAIEIQVNDACLKIAGRPIREALIRYLVDIYTSYKASLSTEEDRERAEVELSIIT